MLHMKYNIYDAYKDNCNEELTHMTMEADKCLDLQSTNWGLRVAEGLSSSLPVGWLEIQEEPKRKHVVQTDMQGKFSLIQSFGFSGFYSFND